MTEQPPAAEPAETNEHPQTLETAEQVEPDALQTLVADWLSVPEVAQQLDVPLRQVHRMIADRVLLGWRIGERRTLAVPARFLREDQVLPNLTGTLTVLADAGLDDRQTLEWLFTPDESLPMPGAPIDMLQAGRRAEVRKRAQELAW
ncbi:Rv2175c family DNA-binding protein [Dermacoccaceae bacterium W4C1]